MYTLDKTDLHVICVLNLRGSQLLLKDIDPIARRADRLPPSSNHAFVSRLRGVRKTLLSLLGFIYFFANLQYVSGGTTKR